MYNEIKENAFISYLLRKRNKTNEYCIRKCAETR